MEEFLSFTKFAPAERENELIIGLQSKTIINNRLLIKMISAVSEMVVILNDKRHIIFANKPFTDTIGLSGNNLCIGKRLGEAANCVNAFKLTGGCGTTESCKTCGAVNAMIEVKTINHSEKECRILTNENQAFDLHVKATAFNYNNEKHTIFSMRDISDVKRKQMLERLFFHDVLNSAGGIAGLSGLMPEIDNQNEMMEIALMINRASENLIHEIQSQRVMIAAENGDLSIEITEIESLKILKDLAGLYSKHEIIGDKKISIHAESQKLTLKTDVVLLRRVLGNMIKNALEASMPGKTVTISSVAEGDKIRFSVHNETYMPREIQLQLFQRSFTTKGVGRGIGTYSIKLLGEKYLKGKISFESTIQSGTTFYLDI